MMSLVGRDREVEDLASAISAAAQGTGGCIVITGVAGIGKTRLLEAAAAIADREGLIVASGRATELDRVAPLSTAASALQKVVNLNDLRPQEGSQYWQIDLIAERLEKVAGETPIAVCVDDAQWADELSSLALRVMVTRLSSLPILWLLARRPVPAQAPAQGAIGWLVEEGAREIRLAPLDSEALAKLCRRLLTAEIDATVQATAARSGGNPFLLEQLLGALRSTGQVVISDGVASVVGSELPSGFLAAVDHRLRALTADARLLLQIGAVFGRPFSLHAAAQMLHRPVSELMGVTDEALASGTLVGDGALLAFQHDLLREAVYNNMSAAVRSTLHREAATVLQGESRPVIEIAHHLIRSGHHSDPQTVGLLRSAAHELSGGAPSAAADLALRTIEMLEQNEPARAALVSDAVTLLASAGRLEEARTWGEEALRGGLEPDTEARLLLGIAEACKHAGDNTAVVELTGRALALSGVDEAIRAQLYSVRAHALLVDDLDAADAAAEQAVSLGAKADAVTAAVFGNAARSVVRRARGQLDAALLFATEASELAERAGGAALHRHPGVWLGSALAALDRFDEAERVLHAGQHTAERLGTAWSLPLWHFYRAAMFFAQGRLSDVEAEGEAGVRIAEQLGALQLSVPLLALLSRVGVLRGQLPVARDQLRRVQRLLGTGITVAPEETTWAYATFQEANGESHAAWQTLAPLHSRLPEHVLQFVHDPGAAAAMVRIALRAGQPGRAAEVVNAYTALAEANPEGLTIAGAAAHAEGLLRADVTRLRQSAELLEPSPRLLVRASALEDAAMAEHAAGARAAAVRLLESATELYAACGARRHQSRVDRRMRAIGVRRRPTAAAPEPASPLAALTEAELRVVRLVVEGATNREVAQQLFLSPHTVDSHLRHVFAKLGISSRVELTRVFVANAIIP